MSEKKVIDVNAGKKCVEIDVQRMCNRIFRSFGSPMVTVELKPECIEHLIEDVVAIFLNRLEEAVYEEAREEAATMLRNIRGKYDNTTTVTGSILSSDVE